MAAGDLHVIGVNDGKLWHTIRFSTPGGPWQAFVDVKEKAGKVGDFVDVDCARQAGSPDDTQGILHVVGVTGDGRLWYTARDPVTHGECRPHRIEPLARVEPAEETAGLLADDAGELGRFARNLRQAAARMRTGIR